jgi:hypothetical protein
MVKLVKDCKLNLRKKYFPIFAFCLASFVYVLNNTFLKEATIGTSFELFFEEYLNDFFAPFVIFSFIELIVKDKDRKRFFSFISIHILIAVQSFFWEVIRPIIVIESDALWMDVLMYALGTYTYVLLTSSYNYLISKRPISKGKN